MIYILVVRLLFLLGEKLHIDMILCITVKRIYLQISRYRYRWTLQDRYY